MATETVLLTSMVTKASYGYIYIYGKHMQMNQRPNTIV